MEDISDTIISRLREIAEAKYFDPIELKYFVHVLESDLPPKFEGLFSG